MTLTSDDADKKMKLSEFAAGLQREGEITRDMRQTLLALNAAEPGAELTKKQWMSLMVAHLMRP